MIFNMRVIVCVAAACVLLRAADWPTPSGSPQRDGWARFETAFTKDNIKGLELLYKYKADNQARGPNALSTPMIDTRIITYLGFKEMLVFAGSDDNVYSLDADLNRLIWKRHLDYQGDQPRTAASTAVCPGGLTGSVIMAGSSTVNVVRGGRGAGRGPAGRGPALLPPGANRSGEFFVVSSDGYLHTLNTSTGVDRAAPVRFLPANAKVSALNIEDNTIYAATLDNCGGGPNAFYAVDLSTDEKTVVSLPASGNVRGSAGVAIGASGIVYAQDERVLALTPKTLQVKDYFSPAGGVDRTGPGATPIVFPWKGRDVIVSAPGDGRIYLLDSNSLGGPDHQTAYKASSAFRGAFSSWEDTAAGTRWIYATSANAVVGFRLDEQEAKPLLTQAWSSHDMIAPAPPVTANGLVFALATGDAPRSAARATLHVLDAATGEELYSSGNIASTWTHGSGLAVANRRIYFSTHDNTMYCFGFLAEQPQLTGK
jgi:outer membrane protein assembly factor BamB